MSSPAISLTERDFDQNLQLLKEYISSRAPESWNSFYEGDLGKRLLDLIAYDTAMLSYVHDAQTQECFLDTLRLRESLTHFAKLTGYTIRRNIAASLEVYAQVANPASTSASDTPLTDDRFVIPRGFKVTDDLGQTWEVAETTYIEGSNYTPKKISIRYGDITAVIFSNDGTSEEVTALIKLTTGSNQVSLVAPDGSRLSSEYGFGSVVGEGHILVVGREQLEEGQFGTPPDITRNEFAITSIGKLQHDVYDRSILFLDRPWDGAQNFIGKWTIENRNIPLTQGETKIETFRSPASLDINDRKNWRIESSFYPVISQHSEGMIVSGFQGLSRSSNIQSGVKVRVGTEYWEETSSLLFESFDSKAYEVEFNEQDQVIIKFGDGIFGKLIPPSAVVEVSYRVGGGRDGNIPQNSFNHSIAVTSEVSRFASTVWLSNPYTVGRSGQDRESLPEAKRNIAQFVRTNDRAVTSSDYDYLAGNFISPVAGRVKLAKAVLHANTVPRESNIIWVYVWVESSSGQLAAPSFTLKTSLLEYLNLRKMITDEVVILDGATTHLPLRFFYKYSSSTTEDVVREKVAAALNEKFVSLRPGNTMHISQLYEAVESVTDVEYALFDYPKISYVPRTEMEMLVNSLQQPKATTLLAAASKGGVSLVVDNPDLFVPGGVVTLFQSGKDPTCSIISDVSDSVLTLRPETPLLANYTTAAEVINTDYLPIGWQFDLSINLYINYTSSSGGANAVITTQITKKIKEFFTFQVRPGQALLRSTIETLVSKVNGVGSYSVTFNSTDSAEEVITTSLRERIYLKNLVINNRSV